MADIVDKSSKYTDTDFALNLAAVRSSVKTGPAAAFCEDCGDPIPEARRQAVPGCETCVSCQAERERMGR